MAKIANVFGRLEAFSISVFLYVIVEVLCRLVGAELPFTCHVLGAESSCALADCLITSAKCHVIIAIGNMCFLNSPRSLEFTHKDQR